MLLVDDSAVKVMQGLSSPRQQHLALDFATNRRFRRDVFVRSDTPRSQGEAARALNAVVVGSVGDPQLLSTRVKVPRGQISFQPDFIEELKGLLSEGSITLGEATAALGAKSRNVAEIVRNLAFLVAGGALMPFARAFRHKLPAVVSKPANLLVERSLACIIEQRSARAIPSELLGNGVLVKPLEAIAIVELLSGAQPGPRCQPDCKAPRMSLRSRETQRKWWITWPARCCRISRGCSWWSESSLIFLAASLLVTMQRPAMLRSHAAPRRPVLFVLIWSSGFIVAKAVSPHADLQLFILVRLALTALVMGLAEPLPAPSGRAASSSARTSSPVC